jgi:hypothetical protein
LDSPHRIPVLQESTGAFRPSSTPSKHQPTVVRELEETFQRFAVPATIRTPDGSNDADPGG